MFLLEIIANGDAILNPELQKCYGFIFFFCARTRNDFHALNGLEFEQSKKHEDLCCLCKESVLKLIWPDSEQDLDLKMGFFSKFMPK